ncbi:hypothetical protein B7494_g7477 [Chlorociboria aeruginascens]|nr:hypothetical protein B7494_g7477 [Chlorociboria aeruginascens]
MNHNTSQFGQNPEPQPRPFDQLHSERTYLLSLLDRENAHTASLLRQLPILEEQLINAERGHARKRTKKEQGWVKRRLAETTRQEKAILGRLEELSSEIQLRERWSLIETERLENRGTERWGGQQNTGRMFWRDPPNIAHGYLIPMQQPIWLQRQQYGHGEHTHPITQQYPYKIPVQPYNRNEFPFPITTTTENCVHIGVEEAEEAVSRIHAIRSASLNDADIEALRTHTQHVTVSILKRHSIPSISDTPKIWSDRADEVLEKEVEDMEESGRSGGVVDYFVT